MRYLLAAILVAVVRAQVPVKLSTPSPVVKQVAYGDIYIVGVPQCIRPGLTTDVYVDIVRRVGACNVRVELYNRTTSTVFSVSEKTVYPGNPQQIALEIPRDLPIPTQYYKKYYIRVSGIAGSVTFQNETSVNFDNQNVTGFVQTDKAIYKPGQVVHYRIFSLYPDLKINKAAYNIEIRDAKRNKIRVETGVSDPTGLVKGSLLLSDEPVFGTWTITVHSAITRFLKSFDVKEYVLPRIEVTVSPPSFITVNQDTVDVDITGKYTFGESVSGTLLVTAKIVPWWPRNKTDIQPTLQKTIPNFTGSARVTFLMKDVLTLHQYARYYTLSVEANITEGLTGVVASGIGRTRIYEVAEKLEYLPSNPTTFKPTLSFTAYVKLSQQDGTAIVGTPDSLKVRVEYSYRLPRTTTITPTKATKPPTSTNSSELELSPIRWENDWWFPRYERKNLTSLELTVPSDGIVEIDIPTIPEIAESITLTSTYKGKDYWSSAERAYSPSNSFIQLAVVKELRQAGDLQKLRLKSNVPIDSFSLLITSRGRVVLTREETRVKNATELGISFTITRAMAPRARVVAYYRTTAGEIVPDVVTFNVLDPFENKVSVGFSAEQVRPGEDVTMTVITAPNSLVATLVLDKEVLLLKSGNDITEEEVANSLWKFESCGYYGWWWRGGILERRRRKRSFIPWRYPYFGSGRDAASVFSEAGLTILSDSLIYSHSYSDTKWLLETADRSPVLGTLVPTSRGTDDSLQPVEKLRVDFPETWLFMIEFSDDKGEVNVPTKAPDSITSWQATAFAFNDQSGFGISTEPAKLTVVKPFFANLFMPYSVIRGEVLFLQVNVFNYLPVNQTVLVELQESTNYRSLDIDDSGNEREVSARRHTLIVPSGIPRSVVFPIRTLELGDIPITVTARSNAASDGLTKTIRVLPEGVPSEYNFVELVNLTASSQYQVTRNLSYPPGLVDGSQRLGVKLVGDVLGSTVANLAGLVRMSYGCGEQNMVNFAPTVMVSKYLKSVGQLTGERREQAMNYISTGYQRQLNYKRVDGSYSAFGDRDANGSLWLTAFVAKSFVAASEEGFLTVAEDTLKAAYNFIIQRQNKDGSFDNIGKVHNRRLQGQSGAGNALTAYVLTALLESNLTNDSKFDAVVSKAQIFVENYVRTSTDIYELAIAAYALERANSPQADSVLANLESRATTEDGYTYWRVEAEPVYRWEPPRRQTKAASIEATSYVCLVYALKKDINKSAQCLAWLVSQQNDYGGYVSTQDTVVAVQALSAIAPFFYSSAQSGSITVEADGNSASFTVNDANRLELQQATLPISANSVTVTGTGSGVFLVSISAKYNIDDGVIQPSFSLTATLTRDNPTVMDLTVCARYLRGEASSMANIEIRLPSDFTLTGESKEDLLSTAKRVDVLDSEVLLYFDEIPDTEVCVALTATGNGNINNAKPSPVRVFDYYNPDDSALTFYRLTSLDGGFCEAAACVNDPTGCHLNCSKRRKK